MPVFERESKTGIDREGIGVHEMSDAHAIASIYWIRDAGEAVFEALGGTGTVIDNSARRQVEALVAHAPDRALPLG